jgi:acyl-homoserine lactone acylase PvdQ
VPRIPVFRRLTILLTSAGLAAAAAIGGTTSIAHAQSSVTDYCGGQCSDILPPGENGNETLADILLFKAFGIRPSYNNNQLSTYDSLVYNYTGLTDSQLNSYYNDASFGVPSADVLSTESPETGVTIVRDKATDTPHITGVTRAETEFGAGYAAAEDRLWVMDVLRHLGRGQLSSFAGGVASNRLEEQNLWRTSPYTEADLQSQVNTLAADGTRGAQLKSDIDSYIAGVNAEITAVKAANDFPGEYDLTNQSIQPFTETDLIAIAGVIGGLFGNGGGEALQSALVKQAAEAEYGVTKGDAVWTALRGQNDPETTLTLHNGQSFPYGQTSSTTTGTAMPDSGSVSTVNIIKNPTGTAAAVKAAAKTSTAATASSTSSATLKLDLTAPGQQHPGMSNALVISAQNSASGHPIAVFGPQTGYFSPNLLMTEEIQGPGISARGIAFAGLSMYVEIGRGPSYSWSATSGEQQTSDTYAVKLCNTDGSTPTTSSTAYMYNGVCTAMTALSVSDSWSPTLADGTAAGSYTLTVYRTNYGLVEWTGAVGGAPVAYTVLRSQYMHEALSAIGFQMFDDPSVMSTTSGFESAASNIAFDFNWFYVNNKDTAYYLSGLMPLRATGTDANLPMWGNAADAWQGFDPMAYTATYYAASAHPNSTNQDYYVSWNNKQAADFGAADGNFSYGPVQRVDLLDSGIKAYLATGKKFTRAGLVQVMETAALTDLRGKEVLPYLLQVINSAPITDSGEQTAVNELTTWLNSGAMLVPTSSTSQTYANATAIQIMDAWWPLLVTDEFESGMGTGLFNALINDMQVNESPSGGQQVTVSGTTSTASDNQAQPHKGSSFQMGWWGYVSKDIRSTLGDTVQNALPVSYCGTLTVCRATLLTTLAQAASESASTVYPADSVCSAGNQWCADSIEFTPLGGITDPEISWQNRPTYQQVVEFPSGP